MIVRIYFPTGEWTVFSGITDISELNIPVTFDKVAPSIILKRGAEIRAKFFAENIAGYSKQEDDNE